MVPPMWSEIVGIYRASKKKRDVNWFTEHVARPPAAIVVYFASKTRITPNQITFLSVVVAAIACAMWIFLPEYHWVVAAALVFEFSFVLDCADGQLARLRRIASPLGHLLDFLMDELKAMLLIGSIATRLWLDTGDPRILLAGLGGLFVLAAGISLTTFIRRPEYSSPAPLAPATPSPVDGDAPPDAAPAPAKRRGPIGLALGFVEAIAKFLVHYPQYIWIAAVANRMDLFFWAYAGVNALYFAKTFAGILLRLGRFAPHSSPRSSSPEVTP